MRGKFITTALQLAVLSGSKKTQKVNAINANAILENFQVIWCREITAMQIRRKHKDEMQWAQTV